MITNDELETYLNEGWTHDEIASLIADTFED